MSHVSVNYIKEFQHTRLHDKHIKVSNISRF